MVTPGCHERVETAETHIFHNGETAHLAKAGQAKVYLAVAHNDAHTVAHLVETAQTGELSRLCSTGKVVEADSGTPVRVVGESFNERQVEVSDGSLKGKTGWIPYEWLKR